MKTTITKSKLKSLPYGLIVAFAMAWMIECRLPDSLQIVQSAGDGVGSLALTALSALLVLAFSPTLARLLKHPVSITPLAALCLVSQITYLCLEPWFAASASIGADFLLAALGIAVTIFQISALIACLVQFVKVPFFDCLISLVIWQAFVALIQLAETLLQFPLDSYIAPIAIPALLWRFEKARKAPEAESNQSPVNAEQPDLAEFGIETDTDDLCDNTLSEGSHPQRHKARLPYKLFFVYALCVFSIYLVNGMAGMGFDPLLPGLLAAVALMFGALAISKQILPIRKLYYAAIALLEASIVMLSFSSPSTEAVATILVTASYAVFSSFFFAALCSLCRRSETDSVRIFAGAYLVEHLAAVCGAIVATQIAPEKTAFALVVLTALTAFAFARASTNEDYRNEWGTAKASPHYIDPVRYVQDLANTCTSVAVQYSLSPRESDVLLLLAQHKTVPQIAEELYVAQTTVKTHTSSIYKKLGIHSRRELFALIGIDGTKTN